MSDIADIQSRLDSEVIPVRWLSCKAALKIDPPSASKNDPPEKGKKVSFCA